MEVPLECKIISIRFIFWISLFIGEKGTLEKKIIFLATFFFFILFISHRPVPFPFVFCWKFQDQRSDPGAFHLAVSSPPRHTHILGGKHGSRWSTVAPSGIRLAGLPETVPFPCGWGEASQGEHLEALEIPVLGCLLGRQIGSVLPWSSYFVLHPTFNPGNFRHSCLCVCWTQSWSLLPCAVLGILRNRQCIYSIDLFPLPITNVSQRASHRPAPPSSCWKDLGPCARSGCLLNHLQPRVVHASWRHAALFSAMAHLSQVIPGANTSLFPSATPSQASLWDPSGFTVFF